MDFSKADDLEHALQASTAGRDAGLLCSRCLSGIRIKEVAGQAVSWCPRCGFGFE